MSESSAERTDVRVGIVGGGLAGLAAAAMLVENGFRVALFESRQKLGGRATSFREPETDQWIDHCQHVGMGCCTSLIDFWRRTGIEDRFIRHQVIHFIGPDGERADLSAVRWLPVPLHLAPSLWRMKFLTVQQRIGLTRCLLRLKHSDVDRDGLHSRTMDEWLTEQGQSSAVRERFWSVVLVSALGETLDRVSVAAARKVFVDGFMTSRDGYQLLVPQDSLSELYDQRLAGWLRCKGVQLHLNTAVRCVQGDGKKVTHIETTDGNLHEFDAIIAAVPWRQVDSVLAEPVRAAIANLAEISKIKSSPITAVHLWYDRSITDMPHAVLVGRLSQWLFNRGRHGDEHYYQVVISASRELPRGDRHGVITQVCNELASLWPAACDARLLRSRLVTDPHAVFSVAPGVDSLRPTQVTPIRNFFLAGDWTATGWPATMEGAVRSGHLAAEGVLALSLPELSH